MALPRRDVGLKLLFVDDNQIALDWASKHFTGAGFTVYTYNKSFGILAFILLHKPDVLFLDVLMPAVNGDTVCRSLKQNAATKNVRVILCSSIKEGPLAELVRACGADGYVVKTANAAQMFARMQDVLKV